MPIIQVNHVSKEYRLGQLHSLKQNLQNAFARLRGHPVVLQAPFKALDDVDFKVEDGEVLGIIGENGAGKSTLLKLLAGISVPTRGRVSVPGSVAPLIEVGAGMVPDLTGRENIYLNAVILGMRRAEIRKKFDAIVAFAELGRFIDGHQHVQLFPQIRDAVLTVAKELAPDAWVRQCGSAVPLASRLRDRKGVLVDFLSRSFRRRAQALGVRTNPG